MYTHTRAYINEYAYIYMDIHIYIYTHIHTHLYTHTCTHIYIRMHMHTYAQIKNLNNNASTCQAISQTHIRIHIHMHAYTHIYAYTHMHTTCSECVRRGVRWCKKNTYVTYTPAHALVPKTPVPKCMQHSLQKNAHIYTLTHICIRIHMHTNTHAHA